MDIMNRHPTPQLEGVDNKEREREREKKEEE